MSRARFPNILHSRESGNLPTRLIVLERTVRVWGDFRFCGNGKFFLGGLRRRRGKVIMRRPERDAIEISESECELKMSDDKVLKGGCLCGGVRFEIRPPMRDIVACHCRQCRKSGGHYLAATAVRPQNFSLTKEGGLRWFRSSEKARRGFCGECGSSLFWKPDSGDRVCVFSGALDSTGDLQLVAHIFAADKGGYYSIAESPAVKIHQGGGLPLEI